MKAIHRTAYGSPDVLKLVEIEKPVPGDHDVQIKIIASAVTPGDCEIRRFDMPTWIWLPLRLYMGITKPRNKMIGSELAGVIENVGAKVSKFKVGDAIFATTAMGFGSNAEYICLPEDGEIVIKPNNMSFEEAAVVPMGAINALHFMRRANIKPGESVLIYGSAGNIGSFAIQIANHNAEDLEYIKTLIEEGKLKSLIDKTFTLEQIVEAHEYVESGAKIGQVSLSISKI